MITTRTIPRLLVAAALLLAPAVSARADEKEEFGRLTVEQVAGMLRRKDVHVFDNNPKARFEKLARRRIRRSARGHPEGRSRAGLWNQPRNGLPVPSILTARSCN